MGKKVFILSLGAICLLLSAYFAFTGKGGEVVYGTLIVITVACVILASVTQKQVRRPLSEHISSLAERLTPFDYLLLGGVTMLVCALGLLLPGALLYLVVVGISGSVAGLLLVVLFKHSS